MPPGLAEHLPILLGAGALTVGGIISVLKGYKWLLREIRDAISEALSHHEQRESDWQGRIERRLDAIEAKMDELRGRF